MTRVSNEMREGIESIQTIYGLGKRSFLNKPSNEEDGPRHTPKTSIISWERVFLWWLPTPTNEVTRSKSLHLTVIQEAFNLKRFSPLEIVKGCGGEKKIRIIRRTRVIIVTWITSSGIYGRTLISNVPIVAS